MNEQQVAQAQDEAANAASMGTEAMLRGLPRKPVPAATYATLQDAAAQLLEAFGTPEMAGRFAPVGEDAVARIDPGLGEAVVAFATFFEQTPQAKKYTFKVQDALADEDGMMALADSLMRAAKDKALVAVAAGPAADKAPPPETAPQKTPPAPPAPKKMDARALMGKE